MKIGEKDFKGYCGSAEVDKIYLGTALVFENTPQPDNEIWYTSTDGNVVNPSGTFKGYMDAAPSTTVNASILSNTYDKRGVIRFDVDHITEFPTMAFNGQTRLSGIKIPKSVTKLNGSSTFYGCPLTSLILPEGLTNIPGQLISSAVTFTTLTIPSTVTSLTQYALYNAGLTKLICKPTVPPTFGNRALDGNSLTSIKVPPSSISAYMTASGWSDYADIIGYREVQYIYTENPGDACPIDIPIYSSLDLKFRIKGIWRRNTGDVVVGCDIHKPEYRDDNDYRFFNHRGIGGYTLDIGSERSEPNAPVNVGDTIDLTIGNRYVYDNINETYLTNDNPYTHSDLVRDTLQWYVNYLSLIEWQCWEGETLVFNGHAAVDPQGKAGIFDRLSGDFYTNNNKTILYAE